MNREKLDHIEEDLKFLDELDIEKMKYDLIREMGPLSDDASLLLDAAESQIEIVPPEINVRISKDGLKAYLIVRKLGNPIAIREEDIEKALEAKGIKKDISENAIEEILVEKLVGQEVLIAEGKPPQMGRAGEIKVNVLTSDNKPENCVDSRGRVDFKRLNQSGIVESGNVIAEKIPAIPGKDGYNVKGEILKSEVPKEAEFVLTPDVGINPKNSRQLVALKSGILKKDFSIEEKVFINGDIDYSTGNIEYDKSVIIKGDVKTGFEVFCGEDLEVRGCVEDARVVANGNIVVKQGFLGDHKGHIRGHDITIGHIKQQEVFASNDLTVGGEAIHCDLHAAGFIKMIGVRGIAIGGQLIAGKGIELVTAGNIRNTKTFLRVGCDANILEIESLIEDLKEKTKKAEKMKRIFEAAITEKGLSPSLNKMMQRLEYSLSNIAKEIENLVNQRLSRIESLVKNENPYIKVSHAVYPNTTIQIGVLKKLITMEMHNKSFRIHNDQIFIGA